MFVRKGKPKWMAVAVAGIVLAVAGFYFWRGQNDSRGGEFSGWKTYKNAEYGFEVKYPAALAGKENISEPGDGTQGGIGFSLFKSLIVDDPQTVAMVFGADKFITNPEKTATSTLLVKDECLVPVSYESDENMKLAAKKISGADFTRIETGQEAAAKGDMTTHYIGYVGKADEVCYRFFLYYAKDDNSTKQADIDLFEKMISTVVFAAP